MPGRRKPQRQCLVCRARSPKTELLRLGLKGQELFLDLKGNSAGRGAYVHLRPACAAGLVKKGLLTRAFRLQHGVIQEDMVKKVQQQISRMATERL